MLVLKTGTAEARRQRIWDSEHFRDRNFTYEGQMWDVSPGGAGDGATYKFTGWMGWIWSGGCKPGYTPGRAVHINRQIEILGAWFMQVAVQLRRHRFRNAVVPHGRNGPWCCTAQSVELSLGKYRYAVARFVHV